MVQRLLVDIHHQVAQLLHPLDGRATDRIRVIHDQERHLALGCLRFTLSDNHLAQKLQATLVDAAVVPGSLRQKPGHATEIASLVGDLAKAGDRLSSLRE